MTSSSSGKKNLQGLLRQHISNEARANTTVQKTLIEARYVLPTEYWLKYDIDGARQKMHTTILKMSIRLQNIGVRVMFGKWKAYIRYLDKLAEMRRKDMELKLRHSSAAKFLFDVLDHSVLKQNKTEAFKLWKRQTILLRNIERICAAIKIQALVRRILSRPLFEAKLREAIAYREKSINFVFSAGLLIRKHNLMTRTKNGIDNIGKIRIEMATKLQKFWRQSLVIRQLIIRTKHMAEVVLQKQYQERQNRIQDRRRNARRRNAARSIQRCFRAYLKRAPPGFYLTWYITRRPREKRIMYHNSIVTIQCAYRRHVSKQFLKELQFQNTLRLFKIRSASVTRISRWWRPTIARLRTKRYNAATHISRIARGHSQFRSFRQMKLDAVQIQSAFRGHTQRKQFQAMLIEHNAALIVQRAIRAFLSYQGMLRVVLRQGSRRRAAAITIQCIVRQYLARKAVDAHRKWKQELLSQMIGPVPVVQTSLPRRVSSTDEKLRLAKEQEQQRALELRCLQMQRFCRKVLAKKVVSLLRKEKNELSAALMMQKMLRGYVARKRAAKERKIQATFQIQAWYRRRRFINATNKRVQIRINRNQFIFDSAAKIQAQWRRLIGIKDFRKVAELQKKEIVKAKYIRERRRLIENENQRKSRLETALGRQYETKAKIRETSRTKALEKQLEYKERIRFHTPEWGKNLFDMDKFREMIMECDRMEASAKEWRIVQSESGTYFHNRLTGEKAWQAPLAMIQQQYINNRNTQISQYIDRKCEDIRIKRLGMDATQLLCKQMSDWVSKVAFCNAYATLYCAQCNEVFCEHCYTRFHNIVGPKMNHHVRVLEQMFNPNVCVECQEQLANRLCHVCMDHFCHKCFKAVHEKSLSEHTYDEISLDIEIPLERGDVVCPGCELVAAQRKCKMCEDLFCDPCFEEHHKKGKRSEHIWEPANEIKCWEERYEVATNRYYYYNIYTDVSMYDKPYCLMDDDEQEEYDKEQKAIEEDSKHTVAVVTDTRSPEAIEIEKYQRVLDVLEAARAEDEKKKLVQKAMVQPSKYKKQGVLSGLLMESPGSLFKNPVAAMNTYNEKEYEDKKAYLCHMLVDDEDQSADVDKQLTGSSVVQQQYRDNLLTELSQVRKEIRKEGFDHASEQLSNKEFKKQLARLKKDFGGNTNIHKLNNECERLGICFGPKYDGAANELTKDQAFEQLVFAYHREKIEKKRLAEAEKQKKKDAKKAAKVMKEMDAKK